MPKIIFQPLMITNLIFPFHSLFSVKSLYAESPIPRLHREPRIGDFYH